MAEAIVLEKKLHDIASILLKKKAEIISQLPVGILEGKAGILLFLTEYVKSFPNANFELLVNEIEDSLINDLSGKTIELSPSRGAPGIIFSLWYKILASKEKFVNNKKINEYLLNNVYQFKDDKDLLHGFIGSSHSLFIHPSPLTFRNFFEFLIENIKQQQFKSFCGYYSWPTSIREKKGNEDIFKVVFNTGLSHGFPAVMIFLCKVHQLGIKQKKIEKMLLEAIEFCKTIYNPANNKRFFPTSIEVDEPYSQNWKGRNGAWCYGDFGIIIALLQAGTVLKQTETVQFSYELALKTLNKKYEITLMNNPMFCHGEIGIVHIYNRFYQVFGDIKFKEAANSQLEHILKHYYKKDKELVGRIAVAKSKKFYFPSELGLLEGLSGFGLVLLSYLNPTSTGNWDILFYTDIQSLKK